MKMPMWGVLPGVLLAVVAAAQTNVYKCTDGEHPVYQQMPCQGQAEWRWEVPAVESKARGPLPAAVQPARRGAKRTPRRGRAQGVLISITADPQACERARQQQVKTLAKPRRLDYLQRRQLDDAVREACR
ncbi:hypothetical protein DBR33_21515 [Stenotrophomonas sp. HMWF022]|uniref:hypothetical protein n=1 Tax=Stenotrophomonas sp. HMWF023 TaxID=2056859 RepID=UPI000D388002|nr:hypothetical protein [Stenotrophomonas sp. HMWF023]PTS74197.1 hypothetical protein DBR20_14325 [Stenotrophomonas sp. HMWF023]PTT35173.1 hypothetical protein DBR33_21515 [Stenotrophomonas sp. HMWF022]